MHNKLLALKHSAVITFTLLTASLLYSANSAAANSAESWQEVEENGRGSTVYFNYWGGDINVNNYVRWVGQQVKQQYDITLVPVKLTDTSEAVSRVIAEKSADNNTRGSIDLIWINGENFATMQKNALLLPHWAEQLPNFALTNPANNMTVTTDFTLPTEGMESPWGRAALTFYYNQDIASPAPDNLAKLLVWSRDHKGQFTYPQPPDFEGSSFLKYLLISLNKQDPALYHEATSAEFDRLSQPLWQYLEELHPNLWRSGQHFPRSGQKVQRLVGDGELSLAFTFFGANIPNAVDNYALPESIRSYAMQDGTLTNTHFVGIPYNASHKNAAKVVANFLLSVAAQAKKQQTSVWGDLTVLDMSLLTSSQQAEFTDKGLHPSALPSPLPGIKLAEPHPSWMTMLESEWARRYGVR